MLNKQQGNMYEFVTHTWNVVKGKCPHDCSYCYMKRFPQPLLHFDDEELKTNLGTKNFIFVGSSCDMWAKKVPSVWIRDILDHCGTFENTYLFQTKNPARYEEFREELEKLRPNVILGTTIETNRTILLKGNAPDVEERTNTMIKLRGFRKMVTIEPAIDFDVSILVDMIDCINPEFVNIGVDSKGHSLQEPSWFKITQLEKGLKKFTQVNLKDNLRRIKNAN